MIGWPLIELVKLIEMTAGSKVDSRICPADPGISPVRAVTEKCTLWNSKVTTDRHKKVLRQNGPPGGKSTATNVPESGSSRVVEFTPPGAGDERIVLPSSRWYVIPTVALALSVAVAVLVAV
jgi:hypothetical protein